MAADAWREVTLGEVCIVNPRREQEIPDNLDVTFLAMQDVSEDAKIITPQVKKFKEVKKGFTSFSEGDVLIAKITPCFENGKGALAKGLVNGLGAGSTEFHVVRANSGILPELIYLHTTSATFRENGAQNMTGSAGQKRVTKDYVGNYKLSLPPISEQKKIAEILGSVDEVIEKTEAVISQAQKVKQGLLQTLLTKGIGHTKFKQTEIGEIPESWEITSLHRVAFDGKGLQTGPFGSQLHASDYSDAGYAVIMPKDIHRERAVIANAAKIPDVIRDQLKKHILYKGDILFGRRGDIGRCGIITQDEEGSICGTGCLKVRVNAEIVSPDYLIKYLQLPYVQQYLLDNAVGQTMLNLNTTILGKVPVLLPPLQEQKKIFSAIQSFDSASKANNEQLAKLKNLKAGLMLDLLTGRVRVNLSKKSEKAA